MQKDTKILLGILLGTFVLLGGLVFLSSRNSSGQEPQVTAEVSGIEVNPASYSLGDVPINGGIVTKDYEIKNTSGKTIKLKKISTSCMCTKAKVKIGDKESQFFGMEGMGDANPPINWEIAEGQTAIVTADFDPAAHGPAGLGPIDRSVFLTFSDPAGVKELKFNGSVVAK
jgi:hypothetical protein